MLSPLRNRFGIPGVISVIALVFAMFGGAYAATNTGGKATSSAKAKKGPRGPKGATGPAGPQGPVGPAGAKGDNGAAGSNGSNGTDGKGAEAVSFTGSKGPIGGVTCTAGGLEVKSASATTLVCNGKPGTNGQTGFTETLPPGKTETGAWAIGELPGQVVVNDPANEVTASVARPEYIDYAISFPIPLPEKLVGEGCLSVSGDPVPATCHVHYINQAGEEVVDSLINDPPKTTPTTVCTGSAAAPTAPPGHLCVYQGTILTGAQGSSFFVQRASEEESGASTAGAVIRFNRILLNAGGTSPSGRGTWAVTAEG
jgi:hypothetical protein